MNLPSYKLYKLENLLSEHRSEGYTGNGYVPGYTDNLFSYHKIHEYCVHARIDEEICPCCGGQGGGDKLVKKLIPKNSWYRLDYDRITQPEGNFTFCIFTLTSMCKAKETTDDLLLASVLDWTVCHVAAAGSAWVSTQESASTHGLLKPRTCAFLGWWI